MSKDEIQRLYEDLGIGDEAERRRYAELARMDEEDAQMLHPAPPDRSQWLRWGDTCGPVYDEEIPRPNPREWLRWDITCGPSRGEEC